MEDKQPDNSITGIAAFINASYEGKEVPPATPSDLHYRYPASQIEMPTKFCESEMDWLSSENDLNLEKNIKSLSLDPVVKRIMQEKEDIMRAIEGWVASQANDGARQPILQTKVVKYIKKAIGYARCGMKIARAVDSLITEVLSTVLGLIDTITTTINSNFNAANKLMGEIEKMRTNKYWENEAQGIALNAILTSAKDPIALLNEYDSIMKELDSLSSKYSKDTLMAMRGTVVNMYRGMMMNFKQTMNRLEKDTLRLNSAKASVAKLEQAKSAINAMNWSVPLNPNGAGAGSFTFTATNNSILMPSYDSVTKGSTLAMWDGVAPGDWADVFRSNQRGSLVVSSNPFGIVKLCMSKLNQERNTGSSVAVRLTLNGGMWVLEAEIFGMESEVDDKAITDYATKYGVFTRVPGPPKPEDRVSMTVGEYAAAINCPESVGTIITDDYGDSATVTKDSSDCVIDLSTLSGGTYQIGTTTRYLNVNEILFYENQYSNVLQTMGTGVVYSDAIEEEVHTGITLTYRMYNDTQLVTALLGKKPYSGMQIFTNAICLQIARRELVSGRVMSFSTGDHVIDFGMEANWGFSPLNS